MSGTEATRSALGERISYAQCWEDPAVLQAALRVGPGDDVLSICSAGDNAFALLAAGAESVTCIDLSAPQIALAKLKLVAAGALNLDRFRSLLGLGQGGQRLALYHEIRSALDSDTRSWWDAHEEWIRTGLVHCGKFERYLGTFRTRVLPLVHGRDTVDDFLALADPAAQRQFYDERWNTWRWRALFRVFFSQFVMQRRGRSAAQFAHVQGPVSTAFFHRTEHALTEIPIGNNPFVQWMLCGEFHDLEASHPYLSAAGHALLAERAERIRFVHADLISHLKEQGPDRYSAFNLSDVPEYLSEAEHGALLSAVVGAARSGARLAYWNLLVPRHRPDHMADRLERDESLAARLLKEDRAFVYGGFQVETVQ
jgi:S-adenosylmethionine-diacylglycerol 3-amino-3-carboxypropyl transferase